MVAVVIRSDGGPGGVKQNQPRVHVSGKVQGTVHPRGRSDVKNGLPVKR